MEIIEFKALPDNLILPLTSIQAKLKIPNWHSALQSKGKKFIDKKGNTNYTFVLNGFKTETIEKNNIYFDNLIIKHSKKEGISYFIVRYHPEKNWLRESKDFQHFNGRLSFYGLKGNPLGTSKLKNGESITDSQNTKSGHGCALYVYPGVTVCSNLYHSDGTSNGYSCLTSYEYKISCGSGGGVDSYPDISYDDPTNPDGGGSGSTGGSTYGDDPDGLDEVDGGFVPELPEKEEKINTDELNNPCVEGIIEELLKKDMTLTGDLTHISQYILDLFNNSSDNSLYFESSQLGKNSEGNDINATTTPYLDGWKINLDTDLLSDGTKLSIGKTIIHESVHAWIRLILKEDRTSDIVKDLNLIYQKFQNQDNRLNLTQHEFMGQYVNVFAISLSVFDNHRQPMDYYISLSWGGLETSTTYSQLPNKNEIQKIIADERFNKVDAKGTPCP